ncbi:hypothetical protein [Maribacter polysaccharolyticus]|uniref:hypothetical protein n=1 Tax=Maribacter polysaccharolyticus TaxID=3020831 RepID=UPI00237F4CE3|nr:hypothetical protein [Maribacter polysaccharolyticus]MDE3743499.1 hypothetical protein [Maribacter polysaccharolyticus]
MKKIIHIHSDNKFIIDSKRFSGDFFDNKLLILDTKNSNNEDYHDKALFFDPLPDNLNEILAIVNAADLVVLYNLDFFKSQIVNRVDQGVRVVWRFFGTELYSRKLHMYLSTKSKSFFISKLIKEKVKSSFRFLFQEEMLFYKAIGRADAIVCVFKEEYEYLTRYYRHLPKFIPLSLDDIPYAKEIDFESDYPKKNTVVICNSRSHYNNHLDILELVETCNLNKKINIKILFNYGEENAYTDKVREKASKIEKAVLIDSFLPAHEFIDFYGPVAACVNNSYRQHALGNLMMALNKGVKVYLNKKNPTYTWFKNEGLYIYGIEDLKKDLETGQIHLSKNEIAHNLKCFKKLEDAYSKTDFHLQIMQLLN